MSVRTVTSLFTPSRWYNKIARASYKAASLVTIATFVLSAFPAGFAFAARTVNSGTVDAGSITTVQTGATILASVTVTTDGTGTANDWQSTSWRIATSAGAYTGCVNHTDHNSSGTNTENFSITAPGTAGTYNAYFTAYNNDTCSSGTSGTLTLSNSVEVRTSIASSPFTFGTSNTQTISGWTETGTAGSNNTEATGNSGGGGGNEDEARDSVTSNKFVKIGEDEWICRTIDATGYTNLLLSYFFKGDNDTESDDRGVAEYKTSGSCSDASGWTTASSDNIVGVTWRAQKRVSLPSLSNSSFLLRFRADTSQSDEYFRADDVAVWADTLPSGTIVVDKVTNPAADAQSFTFTTTGTGYAGFSLTDAATPNSQSVAAGSYSVSETVPGGWVQSGVSCVSSIGDTETASSLEVDSGETITCTFNNTKLGTINIALATTPDETGQAFNFTSSASGGTVTLTDSTSGDETLSTGSLAAGTYSVATSSTPAGWMLNSFACTGESNPLAIDLTPGETVTCTADYTKLASFSMVKYTDPATGSYQFTLDDGALEQEGVPASQTFTPEGEWSLSNLLPGSTYSLTETILELSDSDPEWARNVSCDGNYSEETSGSIDGIPYLLTLLAGEDMSCIVNNTQNAVIAGKKFNDTDGPGEGTTGPTLSNWTITYSQVDDEETEENETGYYNGSDNTDENGDYSFLVPPGIYKVCESPEPTWYQSVPTTDVGCEDGYGYQVTVTAGQVMNGLDFGNYQRGSITGVKWNDLNADGEINDGENGLSGWTINLLKDLGSGPEWVDSETTNGSGTYTFENLDPGTYYLEEVQQSGWVQTYPSENSHTATVTSGNSVVNKSFGNVGDSTISGFKWYDADGNGQRDEGENATTTIFTFELYEVVDESEVYVTSTTTLNGEYIFNGLLPGVYIVKESLLTGWAVTYPESGEVSVILGINADVEDVDFGNARVSTVTGSKFYDADQNGVWGEEDGVEDWGITATPMTDTDEGESVVLELADDGRSVKTTTTDEDGDYVLSFLPAENGWWRITEETRTGWTQTTPNEPEYYDVYITSNIALEEYDFGNFDNPEVYVFKWSDADNDGVRDWTDLEGGTPDVKDENEEYSEGSVAGWPIFAAEVYETDTPDTLNVRIVAMATTSATGTAMIHLPETGTFYILEGEQTGWNRTYPIGNGIFGTSTLLTTFENGTSVPEGFTLDTGTYFSVYAGSAGAQITSGYAAGIVEPTVPLMFGNYDVPTPVTETSGGGGGGGGGSNGPIVGTYGVGGDAGGAGTASGTGTGTNGGGTGTGSGSTGSGAGGTGSNGPLVPFDGIPTGGSIPTDNSANSAGGNLLTGNAEADAALQGSGLSEEDQANLAAAAQAITDDNQGQFAAAAAALGDALAAYWWLLLILVLLLGGSYWAWQQYMNGSNN